MSVSVCRPLCVSSVIDWRSAQCDPASPPISPGIDAGAPASLRQGSNLIWCVGTDEPLGPLPWRITVPHDILFIITLHGVAGVLFMCAPALNIHERESYCTANCHGSDFTKPPSCRAFTALTAAAGAAGRVPGVSH